MKHIRSHISLPVVLLLTILAGIIASQAVAGLIRAPRQPVIATVNLQRVFEGLDRREAIQEEIRADLEAVRGRFEQRRQEIEAMRQRLQNMPDGEERDALRDEVAYQSINFDMMREQELRKADIDRSLMLEELFRTVQQAAEELAESQNYDMVLINDADTPLQINPRSDEPREVQLDRQMSRRRMLFSHDTLDISDELITRMNNRYRAGRRD